MTLERRPQPGVGWVPIPRTPRTPSAAQAAAGTSCHTVETFTGRSPLPPDRHGRGGSRVQHSLGIAVASHLVAGRLHGLAAPVSVSTDLNVCPVASAYCSALAVAASTAASRALSSRASRSPMRRPMPETVRRRRRSGWSPRWRGHRHGGRARGRRPTGRGSVHGRGHRALPAGHRDAELQLVRHHDHLTVTRHRGVPGTVPRARFCGATPRDPGVGRTVPLLGPGQDEAPGSGVSPGASSARGPVRDRWVRGAGNCPPVV